MSLNERLVRILYAAGIMVFLCAPAVSQTTPPAQDADTSGAAAAIQKLRAVSSDDNTAAAVQKSKSDAQSVSASSATAARDLPFQGTEEADISAALALVQQMADKVAALTPDASTLNKAKALERQRALDDESKTDRELIADCLKDLAPDLATTLKPDLLDKVKAVLCASRPSYIAGPSQDQGPLFSREETQNVDSQTTQYTDAQRQYLQALQNLNTLVMNYAQRTTPTSAEIKGSQTPQISNQARPPSRPTTQKCPTDNPTCGPAPH